MDSSIVNDDNDQASFSPKSFIEEDKINDFREELGNKVETSHRYPYISTLSNRSDSPECILSSLEREASSKSKTKCFSSLLKIEEKLPIIQKRSGLKSSISSMSCKVQEATARFEQIKQALSAKEEENQNLKGIISTLEDKLRTLENKPNYCGKCYIF